MLMKIEPAKLMLIGLLLACTTVNAQAATDSAQVTVSATVVDNTCTPGWPSTGVQVNLERASLKDFTGTGSIGASKPFQLLLKDCGSGATSVTVTAGGTPDTNNPALFANSAASGASGVGLGIFGASTQETQLQPDGSNNVLYNIEDGKVSMGFVAKLIQSGATKPTSGDFKSVLTLNVAYN